MHAAALPIPRLEPQSPCFQAEAVAPPPPHLLTSPPAHFLPPETTARLLTTALSALEEVKTSPNPVERRRAATTILRYLFSPAPRAPRADKMPQGCQCSGSCADRRRAPKLPRTSPRAASAHRALQPSPPEPSQPLPQTLSAPPLRRTSATPSPAASLLTALATSHDVARQRPWAPTRSAWGFTPYPSFDLSTHVPGLIRPTSRPNTLHTARPPPCEISDAILPAFPHLDQRELRNNAA